MMNSMITCRNICKRYYNREVLSGVTFTTPVQKVTGLIGPNGSGKSTLIRIITGFELPDTGEITIHNINSARFASRKDIMAYMPEFMELYPEYRVLDFIRFLHSAFKAERRDILKLLELESVEEKYIGHLSKGYKQRIKLYAALVQPKKCLILDEPFDGFDPIQLLDIFGLIRSETSEGRTFFLSIHQLADAEKICDYFLLLDGGILVAQGTIPELQASYDNEPTLERIFIRALT